jgi:HAD superfamily hydrolase (TIGR01490 family)
MSATAAPARPVAVFDLDGTLVTRDTLLPFLLSYARSRGRLWPLLYLPLALTAYLCGLWSARALKERLLVRFLGGEPASRVREHAEWFCRAWLPSHLHPVGLARLRRHQRQGHRVVLLSASPSVYVPEVAAFLGVEEVVCTRVRVQDGVCQGQLVGPNCKGADKLALLQKHLRTADTPGASFAYGDSRADLPVLGWVEQGFLVGRNGCHPIHAGASQ